MYNVFLTRLARATVAVTAVVAGAGWSAAAMANEAPALGDWSGATGLSASASATTAEGVEVTVSVAGDHVAVHETLGLNAPPFGQPTADLFTPAVPVDGGWLGLSVSDEGCAEGATCDRGTLTIAFSRPVLDPVVHLSGVGSLLGQTPAGASEYALVGSAPSGATLGDPAAGAVNLTVADDLVQTADPATRPAACAEGAGCGSIPVTGTVTELTFGVAMHNAVTGPADGVSLLVSAQAAPPPVEPADTSVVPLPDTGAPISGLLAFGAGSVLVGAALVAAVAAHVRRTRARAAR